MAELGAQLRIRPRACGHTLSPCRGDLGFVELELGVLGEGFGDERLEGDWLGGTAGRREPEEQYGRQKERDYCWEPDSIVHGSRSPLKVDAKRSRFRHEPDEHADAGEEAVRSAHEGE